MPRFQIPVDWVKLLVVLVIAVVAFALVESTYVLFNTGIAQTSVYKPYDEFEGGLYRQNKLVRAPPEVEDRIAAVVRGVVGDKKFLAAYIVNSTHYVALLTKNLDLYHLYVRADGRNVTVAGQVGEVPRRAVRMVEQRETTQRDNMTITAVTKYAIYEYSLKTESGELVIYSVGPIKRRDAKGFALQYFDMMCVKASFYNWLPNEFQVCAGGVWWVEWGRAVLSFDDLSYA